MTSVLDLFCGGGGASMGLFRAGFKKVVGVDIQDMNDIYPFEFIHSDVFDLSLDFTEFDLIWASPPCQAYSWASRWIQNQFKYYPDLITATRKLLAATPSIIENVIQAPIRQDVLLCGTMFNLQVIRHRKFELNGFICPQPFHPHHDGLIFMAAHEGRNQRYYSVAGKFKGSLKEWQGAMGIDWIQNKKILAESVPPQYAQYIASQFLNPQQKSLLEYF